MVSELVVLASLLMLMLPSAQLQLMFDPHQFSILPNVQPVHVARIPNSQNFMTHTANSILNQETSSPISPGFLGSVPVLVNDATRNILNQESKVVGYRQSYSPVLRSSQRQIINKNFPVLIPMTQIQQHSPQIFPVTARDAKRTNYVAESAQTFVFSPQSLSIPVLNTPHREQFSSVVPVSALASLSPLFNPKPKSKFSRRPSYQQSRNNVFRPRPTSATRAKKYYYEDIPPNHPVPEPHSISITNDNVYYDIPPNHPVPKPITNQDSIKNDAQVYYDIPPNHPVPPPITKFGEPVNKFPAAAPTSDTNLSFGNQKNSYNEIDYMRPPPPPAEAIQQRPAPFKRSSSKNQPAVDPDSVVLESTILTSSLKPNNAPRFADQLKESLAEIQFKNTDEVGPKYGVDESRQSTTSRKPKTEGDSSSEYSENYYQHALPPPQRDSYTNQYNNYNRGSGYDNSGGYSSGYGDPVVHKHIFVHSAPSLYPKRQRVRVVRPPPAKQEKHMNIIFVKSPQEELPPQTIVELPPTEPPKTVVYVLSKEQKDGEVKLVKPPPSKPRPPEIYFIRYGENRGNYGYGNQGVPVPNLQSLYEHNNGQPPTLPQPQLGDIRSIMPPPPPPRNLFSNLRIKRERDYGLDVYAPLMAYTTSGQINEITEEEADARRTNLDAFF